MAPEIAAEISWLLAQPRAVSDRDLQELANHYGVSLEDVRKLNDPAKIADFRARRNAVGRWLLEGGRNPSA